MAEETLILLIEDDLAIRDMTEMNLNMNGFSRVVCASSGEEGLLLAAQYKPDLILLDIMLPGTDGITVCRSLKNNPDLSSIPVIMLTAKGEENDIVAGLESGADDYLTKPYSSKILAARIAVQLRRRNAADSKMPEKFVIGELELSPGAFTVSLEGKAVALTADEFKTLLLLVSRSGKVFTRNQIIREVKGDNYSVTDRAIDMHIVNLRRKLGTWADHIETIRGIGYRVTAGE